MRIKKFIANTLKEGKALVLKELGEDAVVLSSRTSRNPSTGEDFVEIVAAIDEKPNKSKISAQSNHNDEEIFRASKQSDNSLAASSKIIDELLEVKSLIFGMANNIKYKYAASMSPALGKLYKTLIYNEFPESFALETIGRISAKDLNISYESALQIAKDIISDRIIIESPLSKSNSRKVVFFAGTTGCGKTSTLVKIAVVSKLIHKANILIISADTYKVGGAEQLQTISAIAGISFAAVYTANELKELLKQESQRDLIFIDTTGRSQNSKEHLEELNDFYSAAKPDKTYLVIPATNSLRTNEDIVEKFNFINISSVVLTKLDEAKTIGATISMLSDKQLAISYLTLGQKIPDDIEPAGKSLLIERLLAEEPSNNSQGVREL